MSKLKKWSNEIERLGRDFRIPAEKVTRIIDSVRATSTRKDSNIVLYN